MVVFPVCDGIRRFELNYFQAKKLLDAVKDGTKLPITVINQALCLTGDLDDICSDIYSGWESSSKGQAKVCKAWEVCSDIHTTENQGL